MTNGNSFGGGFPPPGGQPPQQPGGFGAPSSMPAPPSMAPPMAGGAPGSAFAVEIDADPTWEPIEQTDFLEQDGFFSCKIINEKVRSDSDKAAGVFLTLQIQDEDAKGKTISKFMISPAAAQKDVRFVWRLLWLSLTGNKQQAQSAIRYVPGQITGQTVYVKTKADTNATSGRPMTNVETFVTRDEYEAAVKENRHRWKAQVSQAPMGLPGGFPAPGGGGGFPGLPGAATSPGAPAPGGAPMQGGFPAAQQPPQGAPGFPPQAAQPPQQPPAPQEPQGAPAAPQPAGNSPIPGGFPGAPAGRQ